MGFFSSSYETTVGTSVSRVVGDNMLPNSAKVSTINAIMQNGNIAEYLTEGMMGSVGKNAEKYYAYGSTKYQYGLPSGEMVNAGQGTPELEAILTAIHGTLPTIDYCRVGPMNYQHYAWLELVTNHGYNPSTNKLNFAIPRKTVEAWLADIVITVPFNIKDSTDPRLLEKWGISATAGYNPTRAGTHGDYFLYSAPTPTVYSKNIPAIHIAAAVYYISGRDEENYPIPTPAMVTINMAGYDSTGDYVHARYTVNGVTHFFMYRVGLGTYHTLDALANAVPTTIGEYFPFLYFRFNKASVTDDKTSAVYKQSKKMAKLIGMDYQSVVDAVNENPDIKDVEQALMIFAVPAKSDDPQECSYLYDYFEKQQASIPKLGYDISTAYVQSRFMTRNGYLMPSNSIIIQDGRFKMSFSNTGIYRKIYGGSIGEVGFATSSVRTNSIIYPGWSGGGDGVSERVDKVYKYPVHTYRKQISQSFYAEIEVHNMVMSYFVWGNYTTVGDGEDLILLVPLDITVVKNYTVQFKERLYSRAMHYVFNSRVVTKVKWYQKSWFQIFIIIVAIVVTVYFRLPALTQFMAKLAAGAITMEALLIAMAIEVFQSMIVQAGLKLFVKIVGLEAAFLVALIGAVAGVALKLNVISLPGAPWAKDLLAISTGLAKAVTSSVSDGMEKLIGEMVAFEEHTKELYESLKTGQALLETNTILSPLIVFGETPAEFYERTVHSGNIGLKTIDAVHSFVSNGLALPSINQTLGETQDGYL